ncbi:MULTISPECIES: glycosyltransferase family 61 protein [Natronobacterium]|nr:MULTISPECIES: glycosyltransferase family 61 protein [Halobiforma]
MSGTYRFDRPFVCQLSTARLLGADALVAAPNGALLLETSLGRRDQLERSLLAEPELLARTIRDPTAPGVARADDDRLANVCSFVDGCLGGYSHWILKGLPRLEGVAKWERQTGRRATILLSGNPPSWVLESLEYFGYGKQVAMWQGNRATVDGLIVPSIRSPEQPRSAYVHRFTYDLGYKIPAPSACRWLRSVARDVQAVTDEQLSTSRRRRIYISRSDADRRRVTNETKLVESLSELGFESYSLTDLSFAEQVRLFFEAEAVVAPHGAGLANLVFADDCSVLELFGEKIKPTYRMLSAALDLDYEFLRCDPMRSDLRADPTSVRRCVEHQLGEH